MGKPAFIAFTGNSAEGDRFYGVLTSALRNLSPGRRVTTLDNPFAQWPDLKIGNMRKHEFDPFQRTCFRWGLFDHCLVNVVAPAYQKNPDVLTIRCLGFDLCAGAHGHATIVCHEAFDAHERNVEQRIIKRGIKPPLYVFTEELVGINKLLRDEYFSRLPGQRYVDVSALPDDGEKISAIMHYIERELAANATAAA